jgi:CcmD family protein
MSTFVTGYSIVGLAVVLYVARLGREQRRLQEQLESLQSAWQTQDDLRESRSKAA